jgi:large repetitive protein
MNHIAMALAAVALAPMPAGAGGGGHGPPPPIVGGVVPDHGSVDGGTAVTVFGSFFMPRSIVKFGGVEATQAEVVAQDRITAITPPHQAGRVAVTVGSAIRGWAFIYEETGGR